MEEFLVILGTYIVEPVVYGTLKLWNVVTRKNKRNKKTQS